MPRQRSPIPWLKVRDGGHYYVYWYDEAARPSPRTKRLSLGTKDPVEAQARYAKFLAGGQSCLSPGRVAGLTVHATLDDYWREHVTQKVVDKGRAEDAITHLKAYFGPDELLTDVDIPASRGYADARRAGFIGGGRRRKKAEGSDATIRRELVVLTAAANHAAEWKRIGPKATPPVPMPSIELPPGTVGGPLSDDDWLTEAEWLRAVGAASGRLKDFMMLCYYTAARRASIERLTRFQIDLQRGRINLTSPRETLNERRSVKRRPVVPIFPEIRSTIERLLEANSSEWLFGDARDMYRPFRDHMTDNGLAHKSHPHILRHSRATHLLHSGVKIYDVARLLGDTVATVERVYGHHSPEFMEAAISGRE